MQYLFVLISLLLTSTTFASVSTVNATSVANIGESKKDSEVLPSLTEIRLERNLERKVSMLLNDYETFAPSSDSNSSEKVYSSKEAEHVQELKKAMQSLKMNELNVAEKDLLLVSVNRILKHRMENSPSFSASSSQN